MTVLAVTVLSGRDCLIYAGFAADVEGLGEPLGLREQLKVYEPQIRALLVTASHFYEVVVLKLRGRAEAAALLIQHDAGSTPLLQKVASSHATQRCQ